MREALNHWNFVIAAYVLGIGGTIALIGWSWQSMRQAEARRDKSRNK